MNTIKAFTLALMVHICIQSTMMCMHQPFFNPEDPTIDAQRLTKNNLSLHHKLSHFIIASALLSQVTQATPTSAPCHCVHWQTDCKDDTHNTSVLYCHQSKNEKMNAGDFHIIDQNIRATIHPACLTQNVEVWKSVAPCQGPCTLFNTQSKIASKTQSKALMQAPSRHVALSNTCTACLYNKKPFHLNQHNHKQKKR